MASVQDFIQKSQTRTVQHNHVIIQYQQPPDPAIINHALEILVAVTRNYAHKNIVQIPYIQDYLNQIVPFLQLYIVKVHNGFYNKECLLQLLIPPIHHLPAVIYSSSLMN